MNREVNAEPDPPVSQVADVVERVSPEGRPAEAELKPRNFLGVFAIFALLVVVAGVLVGYFVSPGIGVLLAAGSMFVLFFNPALWVGGVRERERERAVDRLRHQP